jgi:hypothetical protein
MDKGRVGALKVQDGRTMPIFSYFALAGSVLVALLFVAGATLDKDTRALVTSDSYGLPKPWHSDPIQTLTAAPAPAPDMTSDAVLAAQPSGQPAPDALSKIKSAAFAARAEAQPAEERVARERQPVQYQQPSGGDRFSIQGQ